MAKKPPETSPRRKSAKKTAAQAPAITPTEILNQLQSGQPIDNDTGWKGYSVEIRDGKVFVRQRVGCVTRTVVNGEPLRPCLPAATAADSAATAAPDAASETFRELLGVTCEPFVEPAPAPAPATVEDLEEVVDTAAVAQEPASVTPDTSSELLKAFIGVEPVVEPAEPAPAAPVAPALTPVVEMPAISVPNANGKKTPPPRPKQKTPPYGTPRFTAEPATPAPAPATEALVPTELTAAQPAQPAQPEPSVVVPAMEAPTIVISALQKELTHNSTTPNEVTIFTDKTERLARTVEKLIGQADLLLKNGSLESGADIPTIINNFEDYEKQVAELERFYTSTVSPEQRKLNTVEQALKTVRELNSKIKGKLLELRNKQAENGEAEKQMKAIRGRKTVTRMALESVGVIAVIAAVTAIVTQRDCGDKNAIVVAPDAGQTNIAPLPPETPAEAEQTMPPVEPPPVPVVAPAQPETPQPSAKKTATFNCVMDTTDQARIRCVDENTPNADVTEELKWAGEYNSETQTVPAEVVLTTPDGQQFKATFDAQIGTRQQLTWMLEAQ